MDEEKKVRYRKTRNASLEHASRRMPSIPCGSLEARSTYHDTSRSHEPELDVAVSL
jgi:hypothetical protein